MALTESTTLSCLTSVLQGNKSFFSEIIASISDIRFSRDGRYILSRDYMNLKLWDMAMENKPVVTLAVHEELRPRVGGSGRGVRHGQDQPWFGKCALAWMAHIGPDAV